MVEYSKSRLSEQITLEEFLQSVDFAQDHADFVADWERLKAKM